MQFEQFLLESEQEYKSDIKNTLNKIPKSHAALVGGFKYEFQNTNTMKYDGDHIGLVDMKNKKIIIASPWNYGREYTLLHELAHMVWAKFMTKDLIKNWSKVVKNTKEEKQKQNDEELFCMAYANYYAKNKIVIHTHDTWADFIKNLPK
jgi:hypothetical protein